MNLTNPKDVHNVVRPQIDGGMTDAQARPVLDELEKLEAAGNVWPSGASDAVVEMLPPHGLSDDEFWEWQAIADDQLIAGFPQWPKQHRAEFNRYVRSAVQRGKEEIERRSGSLRDGGYDIVLTLRSAAQPQESGSFRYSLSWRPTVLDVRVEPTSGPSRVLAVVDPLAAGMAFYHGSSKPHAIGSVLTAERRDTEFMSSARGRRVELFVEKQRPSDKVSRLQAIYLVDDPRCLNRAGASENYVYEVRPIGRVTEANFGWVSDILGLASEEDDFQNDPRAIEAAKRYWAGSPRVGPFVLDGSGTWEWLADGVEIVRRVPAQPFAGCPRSDTDKPGVAEKSMTKHLKLVTEAGEQMIEILPDTHVPGMIIDGKRGARCTTCRFYKGNRICGNRYFIASGWPETKYGPAKPEGSNVIPHDPDAYCSDFYDRASTTAGEPGRVPGMAETTVAYEQHEPGCACEHCPPSVEERLAALERKVSEHMAAEPTSANEYVATNARGDVVFGPTGDYKEAKTHADRAGGVVRFWFVSRKPSAAEDFDTVKRRRVASPRPGDVFIVQRIFDYTEPNRYEERSFKTRSRAQAYYGSLIASGVPETDIAFFLRTPEDDYGVLSAGVSASDFNSRSAALAAAKSQGWTHVLVIDGNREELFRASRGNDGWDKTAFWYENGRWHIGGPSSVERVADLPVGAAPRADLHRPRHTELETSPPDRESLGLGSAGTTTGPLGGRFAVREHVSYADRKKLKASAFALPERRALLLTDKNGKLDAEHVRAAAARLSMMKNLRHVTHTEYEEAHRRIRRAGKQTGVDVSEVGDATCPDWYLASEPAYGGRLHWHRDGEGYVCEADGRRVQVHRQGTKWYCDGSHSGKYGSKNEACEAAEEAIRYPSLASSATAAEVAIIERTADAGPGGDRIATPKQVHALLGERYGALGQEVLEVICANINDELIGQPVQVAMGQASGVRVEVEQVMAAAIAGRAQGATSFWVCHNHPGGTLAASPQDRDLTKRIEAARKVAAPNMEFKGHLVITQKGWAKA